MPEINRRWLIVAIVVAAAAPYLSTITDYFVQDDFGTVMILVKRPWTMFPRWFAMPWMEHIWGYTPDEIRPFVAFTYQLTGKFTPSRPELHHLFNIALHAGNALLVMAIGRAGFKLSPLAAAFAAILFAVLPSGAESAAWITGRVDSMPAFFYLATFLAYIQWRELARPSLYAWSVALFFITLFSKQNAITMTASIAAYDLLLLDRERRGSLRAAILAWTPYIVMTAGYLALRRAVFGHTVRGGVHQWHEIENFLAIVWRHLQRVTLGHTAPFRDWELVLAGGIATLALTALWLEPRFRRPFVCFCLAWWALGAAPILVAGYESPRHVYLASAAWAFLIAMIVDTVYPRLPGTWLRVGIASACAALIALYVIRLELILQDWHALARISKLAKEHVRREVLDAPQGTLFLVWLPKKSWEWGVPFVLQPPFQPEDLTARARVVTPWALYCCGADQWGDYARRQIREWLDSPARPPLVALHFAPGTGAITRTTDSRNPELRELMPVLLRTDTPQALDAALVELIERTAAGR